MISSRPWLPDRRGFVLFPAHGFSPRLGSQENEWELKPNVCVGFICGFPTSVGMCAGPCHRHKRFLFIVDLTIQMKRSFVKMSEEQHSAPGDPAFLRVRAQP